MNNRYIIKCIALKNIETQRTSDDNIIAGKEYWYNPEAQLTELQDLIKNFTQENSFHVVIFLLQNLKTMQKFSRNYQQQKII